MRPRYIQPTALSAASINQLSAQSSSASAAPASTLPHFHKDSSIRTEIRLRGHLIRPRGSVGSQLEENINRYRESDSQSI